MVLWTSLHPQLNTCIDKYMLLHYQSTYSTSHVCHPVYSGYRRPHLPHHSLWQRTTGNDCWLNGELTSTEGASQLTIQPLTRCARLGVHECHVTGTMSTIQESIYFAVQGVCVQDYIYTYLHNSVHKLCIILYNIYSTRACHILTHDHQGTFTTFLWKCLHPLHLDKYMLLHYQSTYSTSHVCHPVYSGYTNHSTIVYIYRTHTHAHTQELYTLYETWPVWTYLIRQCQLYHMHESCSVGCQMYLRWLAHSICINHVLSCHTKGATHTSSWSLSTSRHSFGQAYIPSWMHV